jgi:hypothetical protein
MDQTVLFMADIILTAALLCLLVLPVFGIGRGGARPALTDAKALEALRKKVDGLSSLEDDMAEKQKKLKEIIERLDGALSDVRLAGGAGAAHEEGVEEEMSAYERARSLLRKGEPIEKVLKTCNLTRGEADVLASMNALAS